jgi:hypothetical protein
LAGFIGKPNDIDATPTAPFATDVRIARHDPYSLAHTYHTKVSPLAIAQYIAHFTRPGDVVLDLFCGSGMTGLAAAGCPVESVHGRPLLTSALPRRAVLMDLSPAATHIAAGHAARFSDDEIDAATEIVEAVRSTERELFSVPHCGSPSRSEAWTTSQTRHEGSTNGELDYLVWSEVWLCPRCGNDVIFGEVAYDPRLEKVASSVPCLQCRRRLDKRSCTRKMEEFNDPLLRPAIRQPALVPLFAAYRYGGHRYYRRAFAADSGPGVDINNGICPEPMPILRGERFYKDALYESYGVTHVHHFYTSRNLRALGLILAEARRTEKRVGRLLRFLITSIAVKASKLMNYNADGVGRVLKGTLYSSSLVQECNPFWLAEIALKDIRRLSRASRHDPRHIIISTQSATAATLPEASVDYVWIDPPFGKSLMYAELNQLWEWWLGVHTAESEEAVWDVRRGKDLSAYTDLMARCLFQAHRALKPGRWMTIAFHNSQSAVWNAIQDAVRDAGFVLADVRVLDKKLLTYKQSQQGLPRVDLVLSAYKPTRGPALKIWLKKGTTREAWRFVRRHLARLPVPRNGEHIVERTCHLLFDRMVAHHLKKGVAVTLSAQDFFAGLRERFEERDGMFFLRCH